MFQLPGVYRKLLLRGGACGGSLAQTYFPAGLLAPRSVSLKNPKETFAKKHSLIRARECFFYKGQNTGILILQG